MTFQTETFGPCTLILGDMAEVLVHYSRVFDLVVTDPPYALTNGGCAKNGEEGYMSGMFGPDDYDNSGNLMEIMAWQKMGGPVWRACKADAEAYVMANDKNLTLAHGAFQGAGWKLHNILVWDRHQPTPNRWYMKHLEYTLFLWKGASRVINTPGSKQLFRHPAPRGAAKLHETQKPVELMAHYIANSSQRDAMVLDPFMGSGTTLIAAAELGRVSVGIEVDPARYEVACARVEQAVKAMGVVA